MSRVDTPDLISPKSQPDLTGLGVARSRVASAMELLIQATEWTDKVITSGGSDKYMDELTTIRDRVWALSTAARNREHDLAGIYGDMRFTQEPKVTGDHDQRDCGTGDME